MSKIKIEIQFTILSVIIIAGVITSGYFLYKSLSKIVYSIIEEAETPDYQLFLIKDLVNDLASLENNARLYILSNEDVDLDPYQTLTNQILSKLDSLNNISEINEKNGVVIDSLNILALKKIELWQRILSLHQSSQNMEPAFSELYSKLEEQKTDTTTTETLERSFLGKIFGGEKVDTVTTEPEKRGLFGKIFGRKRLIIDTVIVERNIQSAEIRQEIEALESEIREEGAEKDILESQLIEENIDIVDHLYVLVEKAEKNENDRLIEKTNEADHVADLTYKRFAVFTIAAVILLFIVLIVLFNYLKKMREYQNALKIAKAEAEKLAKAKELFAANVSHELRTPVNAIYGLTEQLYQKPLDKETTELVSILSNSAIHLKNVINNTLDFSKIQANKLKLENTDFSPAEIFSEVVSLQKFEADKKNNLLIFEWEGEQPKALVGDPLRLKQILINLLGNAIKFTQNGKIKLQVESHKTKDNKFRFAMQVIDTGIGISKENIGSIFDEYMQAENNSGVKYQGTGLGLSIVKKLVELHKGKIFVESDPGKGTTIRIEISYTEGEIEKVQKNEFETENVPGKYRKLRFLIADDTEFNRFVLSGILKKWGVQFYEASEGKEAVDVAISKNVDIVLMDLRMPGKNGFEAAKDILKKKKETKIIAISASNEEIDKTRCKESGMVGFLSKPFSGNDLIKTLNSILNVEDNNDIPVKSPPVNISELKRLSNGDEKFVKEMIRIFKTSNQNGFNQIQKALKNNDWDTIRETAHKMAVPYKHLQANVLSEKVEEMESLAKEKQNMNRVKSLFLEIKKETEKIIMYLNNYLNETP